MQSRPLKSVPRRAGQEITRAELVWPGKYDDAGNVIEPPRIALPFQVIEVIEEGHASREALIQGTLPLFGERPRGPEEEGWRNKLIWGDNLLVMGSLLEEFAGKVDLIYIDPPFSTGADFSFKTTVGDGDLSIVKEPSLLEQKAYRDTWGTGREPPINHYLPMMYKRLAFMKELLAPTGSIYIHIGPEVSHYIRLICDEIFGSERFLNEITWRRAFGHSDSRRYGIIHDTILLYSKSESWTWNDVRVPADKDYIDTFFDQYDEERGERYQRLSLSAGGLSGGGYDYEYKGVRTLWRCPIETLRAHDEAGRLHWPKKQGGVPRLKKYETEHEGVPLQDIWTDISKIHNQSAELTGYPTQKPEALLERIIRVSSSPGQLVADFFCGSGTALAVAERLGRRWIGADLGRFAIHTSRKRLLSLRVKDEQTGEERGCVPFEVLNLGRYERKYWQGLAFGDEDKQDADRAALAAYLRFILELYHAQPLAGQHIHGKKGAALVHVGAIDAPVTISQVEQALQEAKGRGGRELHVLGWEWEMGLHDPLAKMAKAQHGVTLRLLSIPREVMDRRAVDAGDVQFFDLAYLEVDVHSTGKGSQASRRIKVKLKDFVIPNTDLIPDEVRNKIRKWSDYIDYWAVDWDFRDDTFVNQWQTYRTRRDRSLAVETPEHTYEAPGKYRILVKVVDIFGNDTSHLLEWEAK